MTLLDLLNLMRKHLRIVVALPIAFAIGTAAFAWMVLPNTYSASVTMYILSTASDSDSITSSDTTVSQQLANDISTLITSDRVLEDAASALQMASLSGYRVSVDSSTTSRVVTLSVTGEEPSNVAVIANQVAQTTDAVAREVMGVESVNVLDQAAEPTSPSGPPRALYTAVAFLAGLFFAVAIIVVLDMANTRVRNAEEVEELLGLPVIGRIPTIRE